ncbi:acetyl/propionyl-CoA carboxylase subuit alpha [Leifsonia sp. Root227]|uniref:ATP-binding protein n=1 Tax=Leifsonia sp. Root227 TaxID=1736496 RepID=UPI0006FB3973|nr:biotin carboxylase N-terminal domain-containing protein [Leifsonia sp. Root227]KRC49984.1 acetyl/propionyl-CoA carboxylase subuit alpha [Leifsonia sp. Root227]
MSSHSFSSQTTAAPFDTVLVANRGEIACRVIRTLRRLGIRSVAVFSDADLDAPHVALADVAVRIGPAPAAHSYLDIAAIVAAARATEAQAVHPGYGFLSENADFAAACEDAGIVFVGPGVHALHVMGDKIAAKREVEEHGVPTIPGIARPGLSDDDLIAAAADIGFPVLVKPSAGGGGKGMQSVRSAAELPDALAAARRVAASAFGDDTLFLERLVDTPRHIEVQVLADRHGAVVHLGERECSLQRRHQKVIEEAPSPLLDAATRARIGEAACAVAASVDYVGAGTVEFLVSDAAPDEFFFMEMNTRLQVEHPVTELVTGLDLVEWQLRIAAGEPLGFAQEDVRLSGHAIEARVYAENPERGFLPSDGRVLALHEASGDGVRVDSGLAAGVPIVTEYDPMLAKVIAWGPDRVDALARLDRALADTAILGAVTNVRWLRDLLADEDVRAGRLDTTLIDRRFSEQAPTEPDERELIAAALLAHHDRLRAARDAAGPLWAAPTGWRLGEHRAAAYDLGSAIVRVAGDASALAAGTARVSVDGADVADGADAADAATRDAGLRVLPPTHHGEPGTVLLTLDGVVTSFRFATDGASTWLARGGAARELRMLGRAERVARDLAGLARAAGAVDPELRTPMPGTVVAVAVATGDRVEAGDTVVTVEAMKMEHRLVAPLAGTVHVRVAPGDLVKLDQLVASVESDAVPESQDSPTAPPPPTGDARASTGPTPSAATP